MYQNNYPEFKLSDILIVSLIFIIQLNCFIANCQNGSWQLWASGLPAGVFPRMTISANHDIYYTLLGTASTPGVVYKANTLTAQGIFTALPAIPLPSSHQNNVECIMTNKNNELIAGIFRTDIYDPWLFRFDNATQNWIAAKVDINPTLGAYSMVNAKNGTLWVGAKWSWVYKSIDNGISFQQINENLKIKSSYPCYYPSWFNVDNDGAIYGVNVDGNNRIYAGTESAGIIYSDDEGINWHPADEFICQSADPLQKDSNSILKPLSLSGNVAGIGFTADNKLIWTGAALWSLGWKNAMACADLKNKIIYPALGLTDYLVQYGQQVSKIVTASNGQIFFHSGTSNGATGIGIYTSMDGINWTAFNTGITGLNDGQSQGSLAVDSNTVFFATHDGKVWKYMVETNPTKTSNQQHQIEFTLHPNPVSGILKINIPNTQSKSLKISVYNTQYKKIMESDYNQIASIEHNFEIDVTYIPDGLYLIGLQEDSRVSIQKLIVHHSSF